MEGTCGKITYETKNNNIIIRKTMKNNIRHKQEKIAEQYMLQDYGNQISKQFDILYVPAVFNYDYKSYTMEIINNTCPIYSKELNKNIKYLEELKIFYDAYKKINYFPNDYECFLQQETNKIAIIDFDKFQKLNTNKNKFNIGPFIPTNFLF